MFIGGTAPRAPLLLMIRKQKKLIAAVWLIWVFLELHSGAVIADYFICKQRRRLLYQHASSSCSAFYIPLTAKRFFRDYFLVSKVIPIFVFPTAIPT